MSDKIFVPPLKIQGIKTKIVPLIRENIVMNDHSVWYEPFMGSGVVGFNIEPKQAVFADVNPHIINFYNEIKDGKITELTNTNTDTESFFKKAWKVLQPAIL